MDFDRQRRERLNKAGQSVVRPFMKLLRLNMVVSCAIMILVCATPLAAWFSYDLVLEACAATFTVFWAVAGWNYLNTVNDQDTVDGKPIRKVMFQNAMVTLFGCVFINVWMIKLITQ